MRTPRRRAPPSWSTPGSRWWLLQVETHRAITALSRYASLPRPDRTRPGRHLSRRLANAPPVRRGCAMGENLEQTQHAALADAPRRPSRTSADAVRTPLADAVRPRRRLRLDPRRRRGIVAAYLGANVSSIKSVGPPRRRAWRPRWRGAPPLPPLRFSALALSWRVEAEEDAGNQPRHARAPSRVRLEHVLAMVSEPYIGESREATADPSPVYTGLVEDALERAEGEASTASSASASGGGPDVRADVHANNQRFRRRAEIRVGSIRGDGENSGASASPRPPSQRRASRP